MSASDSQSSIEGESNYEKLQNILKFYAKAVTNLQATRSE